jgi:hypothetical protein
MAQRAAEWVGGFYPDVTVALDRATVTLACERRAERQLRLIWQTSLLNEQLLARGATQRAGVIEALVR